MTVEVSTPPAEEAESTSLADHEQTFGTEGRRGADRPPELTRKQAPAVVPAQSAADEGQDAGEAATAEERDDKGRFQPAKHRAKSQQASGDDVDKINGYTKRLREAEDAVGIPRQTGESERVYQMRKRAEIAELAKARGQAAASQPAVAAPIARPVARPPAPPQAETFTEKEPTQ